MRPDLRKRHFQSVHAEGRDFWNDPASAYETRKRHAILAHLTRARYLSTLEVGCSTGLLSVPLAQRSDRFLALDLSDTAILRARARLSGLHRARARVAQVPGRWPARRLDLIVLSEMLYYLTEPELLHLAARCTGSLMDGGETVVLCYLGDTQMPLDGRQAARIFIDACNQLRPIHLTRQRAEGPYLHLTLLADGGSASLP